MELRADPGNLPIHEPVGDGLARCRVLRELQDEPSAADREANARAEGGPVDPLQRQVLPVRAGKRLVTVGRDARERLDRVDRHGLQLAAVDLLGLGVTVAVEA